MVMEFLGGGDFGVLLDRRKRLDECETTFYGAEIVLALKHLFLPPNAHPRVLARTHTHTLSLTHSHTHTHTRTLSLALTLTHVM